MLKTIGLLDQKKKKEVSNFLPFSFKKKIKSYHLNKFNFGIRFKL